MDPRKTRMQAAVADPPVYADDLGDEASVPELAEAVAHKGAADVTALSLLEEIRSMKFFSLYSIDLLANCAYIGGPPDECEFDACEVLPVEPVPKKLMERDMEERGFELDAWARFDLASEDYYNLEEYPEGYTGYDGEASHRIWRAVYEENCFDLVNTPPPKEQLVLAWRAEEVEKSGQCLERRVFYKLISGLQASISTHIASDAFTFWEVVLSAPAGFRRRWQAFVGAAVSRCYDDVCLAESNDAKFIHAVGMHEDRLQNMYFAYLFVLRAVTRAGPELENYAFGTGDVEDDLETSSLVKRLVSSKADPFAKEADTCEAAQAARAAFDESLLFKAPDRPGMSPLERALARESVEELRSQFVQRFRNVSTIMDCVTCEKCRLWGKLQVLHRFPAQALRFIGACGEGAWVARAV